MPAKRSPWFNARAEPPVNGGDKSVYEWRCGPSTTTLSAQKGWLVLHSCLACQWRGLLRDDGGKA